MAMYEIHVFCNECGQTHSMEMAITLNDGPADRASIGNTYAGKELPFEILELSENETLCPKTGNFFTQQDNNQVFLVPVG